jgi:hypothetical protein
VGDGVLQDELKFLACKCLPEEISDDDGDDKRVLVQSFHSNLTPRGTHHELTLRNRISELHHELFQNQGRETTHHTFNLKGEDRRRAEEVVFEEKGNQKYEKEGQKLVSSIKTMMDAATLTCSFAVCSTRPSGKRVVLQGPSG